MYHHALVKAIEAQDGTFLAALSSEARSRLLADAVILEIQPGGEVFGGRSEPDRVGIVLRGIVRSHLRNGDGRRLSVRYSRPGTMVGSITEGTTSLGVQAVVTSSVLELNTVTLGGLIVEDGRVGLALVAEIGRRLRDTYATLASNTFGSMRERVARQLLDLATEAPHTDALVAPVTQQGLADGVGTVREVCARVLRDFRADGLIATADGYIELLDPNGLASIVGRSR